MDTSWSIEPYINQLAQKLIDLQQGQRSDALHHSVQMAFDLRRTLTPWLLGQQPLVAASALDDFSRAFLDYCIGLTDEYQDAERLSDHIIITLGRFVRLLQQCESPLEAAFLVGLAAYGGTSIGWAAIGHTSVLTAQRPVERYRIDFALYDLTSERQWAIELDGHTYHERTEEQASYDRARDRALTAAGWTVVRFHRRDVERDLHACIHELVTLCDLPATPSLDRDTAALEAARAALHMHQSQQAQQHHGAAIHHPDRHIKTGFRDLDEVNGGFHRGDLVVIAGTPGVGKTGFVLSLALAVVEQDAKVAVYSGEMTRTQLFNRLLGIRTGIPIARLHTLTLGSTEVELMVEGVGYIEELPLYVNTPPTLMLDSLISGVMEQHAEKSIDLLVVDALHLIRGRNSGYWKADAAEIILSLKRLARMLDASIILVMHIEQIQRDYPRIGDVEAVLPVMGAVADLIIVPYRDELYDTETDKKGIMDLCIVKNRSTGVVGVLPVRFDAATTACSDLRLYVPPDTEE